MMRAIQNKIYGGAEVLQLVQVPIPRLAKNEVLVKVTAASVNSWDWDKLTGTPWPYRLLFGLFKPKDLILGCDISGVVEAVDSEVSGIKVGDAVYGDISTQFGGFAEYVAVNVKNLRIKPSFMSFEDAAALPHTAELAYQALFTKGKLQAGEHVLLHGGGGGTGSFAVQMAKSAGAIVTVVDNAAKKEAVLSWGADFYVDYQQKNIWSSGKTFALIVDMVAQAKPRQYAASLQAGGRLLVVGGRPKTMLQLVLFASKYARRENKKLGVLVHIPNQNLKTLEDWYSEGKFAPIVAKSYPLEQLPQAMTDLHTAQLAGKLLINIAKQS